MESSDPNPCGVEVIARVVAYVSNVWLDEGKWRSSLPALLCVCRDFQAFWLAQSLGQIQHRQGVIQVKGRVHLEGLRVYLRSMRRASAFGSLVLSHDLIYPMGSVAAMGMFNGDNLVGEFVFPAARLARLQDEAVPSIESDDWDDPNLMFALSLQLFKRPCNGFGVRFASLLLRGVLQVVSILEVYAALTDLRKHISMTFRSGGFVLINFADLPSSLVDGAMRSAQPLCISAVVLVR